MTHTAAVHHRTFGQGPRAALAIHCTLGHAGAWRGVAQALAKEVTLTAYDLPGHGKSADWDRERDLHRQCTDAALPFMEAPVDLIGHSFGATVALRLAVEHPQKTRSLTLIEPVFFAAAAAANPAALAAYHKLAARYEDPMAEGDWSQAAIAFNDFWGAGASWDATPKTARQYMIDRMPFIVAQTPMIFEDNAGLLQQGRLQNLSVPTLLLKGENSPSIIDAVHSGLAERLRCATRVTLAGAGHMSPLTHSKQVAEAIGKHLKMT